MGKCVKVFNWAVVCVYNFIAYSSQHYIANGILCFKILLEDMNM